MNRNVVTVGLAAALAAFAVSLCAPDLAGSQPRSKDAAARRGKAPGADIASRTFRNGLEVIVWPDHDIPNVALYTWYRVGSRNEAPGITGISHFFEHMMFNGSERFPAGEFDRILEGAGGANNAWTSQDVTVYQDWFARSALEIVVRMEADRICCLSFDSTSVESERGVVSSERRTSVDNSGRDFLDEVVTATAFVAHPYQFPIIGWPSDIERWTITDLESYFRTHYAPNNATMIFVGDVTPPQVFTLVEKYLEPIPAQPRPQPVRTIEPPQTGERRVTVRRPAPVPLLQMAFHAGPADGAEAEAEDLLETILTSGESSRLYRRLVDRDRVAVGVGSYVQRGFDPGLLNIYVTVAPHRGLAAAESSLVDELALLARDGVTEAELAKAKTIHTAAYWRALKTIDGKAEAVGSYEVFRGDYRELFTAPERYAMVTTAEVRGAARRIFDERNRTVGVLIPAQRAEASGGEPAEGREGK
jgi:zinc protease